MIEFQTFREEARFLNRHLPQVGQGSVDVREKVAAVLTPHEMDVADEREILNTSIAQAHVGNLGMVMLRYGSDVVVRPAPATGFVMLQFVFSGSIVVEHDGLTTFGTAGQGLIIESLDQRRLLWGRDCEQLIIPVRRSLISKAAETLTGRPSPARFDFDRSFDLDGQAGRALMALVQYLMAVSSATDRTETPTTALLGDMLAHHLFVQHRSTQKADPQVSPAPAHVVKAEKFMRANIAQSIDLNQLASLTHVSTRTLCTSFKRFRGTSPMEWLRNYRLDQVRAWLQSGQATTIAHAAACAGFTHPGRFAQIYRERFGESPNETLASLNG